MAETALSQELDYHPCRYGASKILFRGPPRRLRGDYLAYIGGTDTFGPLIASPFPELIEKQTGLPGVNLGCRNAGIDTFNTSPALLDICSMASATVVQVMSAANMSNRFYTVDPRHNERFLRASKSLKELFPEVEFAHFSLTEDMLVYLSQVGPERLHHVRHEVQTAWVARMRTLLQRIEGPKILLWIADHRPFSNTDGGTICREPLFIDRAMLNAVKAYADHLIEIVAKPGEINAGLTPVDHMDGAQHIVEERILGPKVHERVGCQLMPILGELTDTGRNIFRGTPLRATA